MLAKLTAEPVNTHMPDKNSARTASLDSAEQNREAKRYSVLRQGKILLRGKSIYCAIHDLSTNGAKLDVGDVTLPERFELLVSGQDQPLFAEVRWAHGGFAGVSFFEPLSPAEVHAARVRDRLKPKGR